MNENRVVQRSEREAIDNLAERLRRRFPDLPPEGVTDVVAHAHSQFAGAKVRDFVPVLVEQQAVKELKHPSTRRVGQH